MRKYWPSPTQQELCRLLYRHFPKSAYPLLILFPIKNSTRLLKGRALDPFTPTELADCRRFALGRQIRYFTRPVEASSLGRTVGETAPVQIGSSKYHLPDWGR